MRRVPQALRRALRKELLADLRAVRRDRYGESAGRVRRATGTGVPPPAATAEVWAQEVTTVRRVGLSPTGLVARVVMAVGALALVGSWSGACVRGPGG